MKKMKILAKIKKWNHARSIRIFKNSKISKTFKSFKNWIPTFWPFLDHFLITFFWPFRGDPYLIGKSRAFSRISGKPQKGGQKVGPKLDPLFQRSSLFVRGRPSKSSNFGHFGHFGVPKMTTFRVTFWTLFWGFPEIREKALLLPIKNDPPQEGQKKGVRKCLKNGHFLKCQFGQKWEKNPKKTWFLVIFGHFGQKSEKTG